MNHIARNKLLDQIAGLMGRAPGRTRNDALATLRMVRAYLIDECEDAGIELPTSLTCPPDDPDCEPGNPPVGPPPEDP